MKSNFKERIAGDIRLDIFVIIKIILNKFKKSIDTLSYEHKIDCIIAKVAKEYHLQNKDKIKDHNYDSDLSYEQDRAILKECEKIMKELELTYYFEDDAMGAQFYIIYDKNKNKLFTSDATCFASKYINYSLYMKLVDYQKELKLEGEVK